MVTPITRRDGFHGLGRQGDTGDEAAAGERHHQTFDVRPLFHDLQAQGALSRDHIGMIERRQHHHALLGDQAVDLDLGVVLGLTDDAHLGTQGLDPRHLVVRHQRGHADDAARAGGLGGMGEAAAVVAGGNTDDAALALGRR